MGRHDQEPVALEVVPEPDPLEVPPDHYQRAQDLLTYADMAHMTKDQKVLLSAMNMDALLLSAVAHALMANLEDARRIRSA